MSETRKLFESFQHNLNEAIKPTIEYVTPIYTGGGIYVYVGKLNDENYFIAEDSIFNKNMPSFSIRIVDKNPEEDEDDFWNTEWQEEHLVKDMTDGETETKELTKQILDWVIKNQPDGNYDLGDIENKRKILNNINENETVENKKLTKDTRDNIEIGDILADNSNRYVVVNIINNPRSKAITVRDEKDWRPIYADPISNWYGTTIIKGPFIRKNGKVIKEKEMNESEESGLDKLLESFQNNLNETQFKKVDETIILTDEMLNEIPFPSGKIIFNNEIQIPSLNNVYKDGRIRVVIADNNNYWAVSEYDIGLAYGYGGYYLDYVSKSDCPTIESLIEELFINGNFADQGYSIAGLDYPEGMNESESSELDKWWNTNYEKAIDYVEKAGPEYIADLIYDGNTDMYYEQTAKHVALDLLHILGIKEFEKEINYINSLDESEELNSNLIKSYNETDYGYHNNATMVYGELNDGNWYVYIPDNEYLEVFNEPITQKYIDTAYNYDEDNDKSDDEWFDNFHKEHEIKYDKEDLLLRELNKRYFNLEDDEDEEE